jgi:hypothetical protein
MASAGNQKKNGGGCDNKKFMEVATHGLSLGYLRDFRGVVDYLVGSELKKGACIIGPFIEDEKYRYAYVKLEDGSIKRFKISLTDEELRDQGKVSAEKCMTTLNNGLDEFPFLLEYKNFNMQVVKPGDIISIRNYKKDIACFTLSFKNGGQYFDTSALSPSYNGNSQQINYRRNYANNLIHSGDKGNGGYFCHTISITGETQTCIGIAGYSRTPLMGFNEQAPVLVIVDAETRTLYYYPVPLVEAIVGKETTAFIPLVLKVIEDQLIAYILPQGIKLGDNVNSDDVIDDKFIIKAIESSEEMDLAEAIAKSQVVSQADSPVESPSEMLHNANDDTSNSVTTSQEPGQGISEPILTFCQQGNSSSPDIKRRVVYFGKTLSDSPGLEINSSDLCPIISPLIIGPLECGIYPGNPNLKDPNAIQRALDKKLVISHTKTGWNDKRARTWMKSVNGIHIIQIEEEHSSLSKGDIRNRVLSGISLDSANPSGPQSIILVRSVDGHLYWITGIRWTGLIDKVPKFGEEVTDVFIPENINTYAESDVFRKRPFPNLQEKDTSTIFYCGKPISCQKFMDEEFTPLSTLEEALSKMDDLIDAFNQIQQLVMDQNIFADIKGKIAEFCDKFIQNEPSEIKELKLEIVRLLKLKINAQDGIGNLQEIEDEISSIRKKISELKAIYRKVQSDFQPLITLATNFNSFKSNSTIGFMQTTGSLKTVEKQKKMASMIDSAKNSLDSLEKITNTCLFTFDPNRIKELFRRIPAGASLKYFFDQLAFATDNRLLSLCGDDIACFLEMQEHDDLHLGKEGSYLSIMGLPGRQFFVLPLIDEYVHHLCRNWADDAIEDDVRNHFRIWYRGMIAECTLSREININLSPSSPDVGKIYIVMMAQIMLHIKRQFNTKLSYQDGKESTMVAALRSAAGYILAACGSGSNQCFSTFWFFFSANNPMNSLPKRFTELEFWLIKVFAECLPYMGMPDTETKKVDVGEVMEKYQQLKAEGKFQEADQLLKDNISNKNELDTFLDNLKVFVGIQLVKFHMVLPVKEQIIEAKADFKDNYFQECVDKSNLLWVIKFILCQVLENFVEQCDAQFSSLKDTLNKGRKYQKSQMSEEEQKSICVAILSAGMEHRMKAIATSILGMIDYLVKKFYTMTTQTFLLERNGTNMMRGFLCLIRDNKLDHRCVGSLFHVWEIASNVKVKAVRRKHITNPVGTKERTQTWGKKELIWQNPNHDRQYDVELMQESLKYLIGAIINETREDSILVYQKACGILTGEVSAVSTSTDVAPVKISPRDKFIAELGLSPKEVIGHPKISRAVSLMVDKTPEECVDAFLKDCQKESKITASQLEELIKLSGLTPEDINFYWRMLLVNDDEHKVIAALRTRLEKERCDNMKKALQEKATSAAENAIDM